MNVNEAKDMIKDWCRQIYHEDCVHCPVNKKFPVFCSHPMKNFSDEEIIKAAEIIESAKEV